MWKKIFRLLQLLEKDLEKAKRSNPEFPKEISAHDNDEERVSGVGRRLPACLRDLWLLWVYYYKDYLRDNPRSDRREKETKQRIVVSILELALAPFAPKVFFEITDFQVDKNWNLFFVEKKEEDLTP